MKIDLVILSLLLVFLVFLPFILIPLIQNRGSKNLQKKFNGEASRLNLKTDIIETWNQNFIGFDSAQKKLLFVQKLEEDFIVEFIDLDGIKQSDLKLQHSQPVGQKKEEQLQKVILELTVQHTEEKKTIVLYDYDLNYNQDLEVKNAQKVNDHISNFIKSRPVLKRTA